MACVGRWQGRAPQVPFAGGFTNDGRRLCWRDVGLLGCSDCLRLRRGRRLEYQLIDKGRGSTPDGNAMRHVPSHSRFHAHLISSYRGLHYVRGDVFHYVASIEGVVRGCVLEENFNAARTRQRRERREARGYEAMA
eukprot:scaffold212718_cov31-Tisochrysis_lutea.AAC.3